MIEEEATSGCPETGTGHRFPKVFPNVPWGLAALALLGLALLWRAMPASDWVDQEILPWIERLGAWGYVGFTVVYATSVVLMAPGSALTLASGYLFGPLIGALLATASATLGASIAFLIARKVARGPVRRRVEADRRFRAVDQAVAERGAWVVLLLRLSPIVPFNLLNYAMGLTSVRFGSFVLASVFGMLPGAAAYAFIGASAGARRPGDLGWGWWAFLVVSTLLTVGVLARIAAQALARASDETETGTELGIESDPSHEPLHSSKDPSMTQVTDVRRWSPEDLRRRLDEGESLVVLDVREDDERRYSTIPLPPIVEDLHIPIGHVSNELDAIRQAVTGRSLVIYCHHGIRSLATARWLAEQGLLDVINLEGGIDAWSMVIDPSVPRY